MSFLLCFEKMNLSPKKVFFVIVFFDESSIILVLCLTPIFNIVFAIFNLSLLSFWSVLVNPYLAGFFALEHGAIMGGLLISIFQPKNFQLTFIIALSNVACFNFQWVLPFVSGAVIILFMV